MRRRRRPLEIDRLGPRRMYSAEEFPGKNVVAGPLPDCIYLGTFQLAEYRGHYWIESTLPTGRIIAWRGIRLDDEADARRQFARAPEVMAARKRAVEDFVERERARVEQGRAPDEPYIWGSPV